ncbi:MAG: hypothetical protein R2727_10030 [Bacteroidales bacterium]
MISVGDSSNKTGGQWIYVVDPSGEFAEKRAITLGEQNPKYYEILSGVARRESYRL